MGPALLPVQLGQELAACAALGMALGAVRALFPVRGRGAFVPDVLLAGAVVLGCQSYAAGYSMAGVLRWYMVLSTLAAALATSGILGIPLRAARRLLALVLGVPAGLAGRLVLRPLRACRKRYKLRRNAERTAKKSKKNLPKQQAVLYNSNVSK